MSRFKVMNMFADRREQSNKWDTHLCPEIRKKIELLVEDGRYLRVGRSTEETYEVIDENNNAVNLECRRCSCKRWEIHGLPCKHACAAIMQTETNVHSYVDSYFTVAWYCPAYGSPIFPVPDGDKPSDENRPLRIRPPIAKKRPGRPRRRRIESQAFDIRELHCSRCHQSGHNRRSCNAVIADWKCVTKGNVRYLLFVTHVHAMNFVPFSFVTYLPSLPVYIFVFLCMETFSCVWKRFTVY